MEKINKIYIIHVFKYRGDISYGDGFCIRDSIINNGIAYNLKDAIAIGKNNLKDYLDDNEIDIQDELNKNYSYAIVVSIISGNRIRFNTSGELMDYFNNNIDNISNDNLYDFLLSLVESDDYVYDYNGNFIFNIINEQCPLLEYIWDADVDFNEEDCKQGKYTFEYRIM